MFTAFITALFTFPLEFVHWIKWTIAYLKIRAYNASHKCRFDLYHPDSEGEPEKSGYLIPKVETDLESPLTEAHLKESADEILFYGVNSKAECILVRIARECNQEAEAWIYLKLADGKTYQLKEHTNYQKPFEGQCLSFSCGNLEMHYLAPMRRWRIQFCGHLKKNSENKETSEDTEFVKFVFLWTASSNVYDPTMNTNPHGFAKAMAEEEWSNFLQPPIDKFADAINSYVQMGNIRGTVTINEGNEYEMYLFGERLRNMGNSAGIAGYNFTTLLGYVPKNGFAVHLMKATAPKVFKNLPLGFVGTPQGDIHPLKQLDITIKSPNSERSDRDFQAHLNTGTTYDISGKTAAEPIILNSVQGSSGLLELSFISFKVNNNNGYGILWSGEVYRKPIRATTPNLHVLSPKSVPLTLKFTDEISQLGSISGGKGSSLGKLTKLSHTDRTFTVPKGIIVTTSAYENFLTTDIKNAIRDLENVLYGNVDGNIKEACEVVSKNIIKTPLNDNICQSIIKDLKSEFSDELEKLKFAIRSSATGEDTDVMSAAGQMDTFLGVIGLQEIFITVKKCWASQFGHIAVEYKRQNGQVLNSPMAVVIQEMVPCEVAGVLFTCDPVSNNPSIITITANYGLGETVVSGSVEPDTIILIRKPNGYLELKSKIIGSKHQRTVMQENGGTVTEDISQDAKNESCLSEETALALGNLSINVEKFYRSSRDIEWGILNKKIYLFQSRPVTSGGAVTEFELQHEFDSILRSERDYFSTANVGEVMPRVISPLGVDIVTTYFSAAVGRTAFKNGQVDLFAKSAYYNCMIQIFYNRMMAPVAELMGRHGHGTMFSKGYMLSVFGRILDDPQLVEFAKEKVPDKPSTTILGAFSIIKELLTYHRAFDKIRDDIYNYDRPYLKCKTAEETFDMLTKACSHFEVAACQQNISSECSSNWNLIIFWILTNAKGSFDTDVYGDFGRLLATSSDLESADIPYAMQKVARQITQDMEAEKFKAMSLEEAENWLNTSNTDAGVVFRQFIERHGHRCIQESDVYSKTWEEDSSFAISRLQALAGSLKGIESKTDNDYSKIFSELCVPLNFLHKLLLRIILPHCRKGVRSREATKAVVIKALDHWRKGFRHLSKLMVAEGRLPDCDLLYFMTLEEIRTLIKTRYPKIIARAIHRRKIFPVMGQNRFPEIAQGFPVPINEEDSADNDFIADLTMKGFPVSQGIAKGFARVATSLEEAAHIQPGEILIAYSTDIGWSPYFPIISGVVTELGGLISHGAVVSREYGLPCVVGIHGATKKFKTGDFVLLDGKKGILQRIPQPEK